MDAKDLLGYLVRCAATREVKLSKTQLVKMLYLAEVLYAKETGKRLTSLEWIFYHHGPTCAELAKILSDEALFKKGSHQGRKHLFSIGEAARVPSHKNSLDHVAKLILNRIVEEWGAKPLKQLVDYVSLHTEPMKGPLMPGERLNFFSSHKRHYSK